MWNKNGTIVGCGCDNKVNDDDSGKLQTQNAHFDFVLGHLYFRYLSLFYSILSIYECNLASILVFLYNLFQHLNKIYKLHLLKPLFITVLIVKLNRNPV